MTPASPVNTETGCRSCCSTGTKCYRADSAVVKCAAPCGNRDDRGTEVPSGVLDTPSPWRDLTRRSDGLSSPSCLQREAAASGLTRSWVVFRSGYSVGMMLLKITFQVGRNSSGISSVGASKPKPGNLLGLGHIIGSRRFEGGGRRSRGGGDGPNNRHFVRCVVIAARDCDERKFSEDDQQSETLPPSDG